MKKEKITDEGLMNGWLKYHNVTLQELIDREFDLMQTPAWQEKYAVTEEQHKEWEEWAIKTIMGDYHYSKKYVKKAWWPIYLNCAPNIKKETV